MVNYDTFKEQLKIRLENKKKSYELERIECDEYLDVKSFLEEIIEKNKPKNFRGNTLALSLTNNKSYIGLSWDNGRTNIFCYIGFHHDKMFIRGLYREDGNSEDIIFPRTAEGLDLLKQNLIDIILDYGTSFVIPD